MDPVVPSTADDAGFPSVDRLRKEPGPQPDDGRRLRPSRPPRRWWGGRAGWSGAETGYDAFISYSHAGDGELAPALQVGIQRFAKPWYRPRALKVFRDEASLSADPGLWSAIERALSRSSWFVLMASPQAAASPWVDREIRWWLEHRSDQQLLIVVTSGDLAWDEAAGDFDWNRSTAVPRALRGVFSEEPRTVDCRWPEDSADQVSQANPKLQEVIADVASAIHGVDKDELVGVHVREHKRTRRWAGTAITVLVFLVVLSTVAAVTAVLQRNIAVRQANIAIARQLAAASVGQLTTNLDAAQLLAVRAYRTDPNPQTRSALMQAVTASPALVRYLPMGGPVVALAGSGDGRTVVAGLQDGRVLRWNLTKPKPDTVLDLKAAVSSVAVSHDGTVIVAEDGAEAGVWRNGAASRIGTPPGEKAGAVTLSPSGRTAVMQTSEPRFEGNHSIVILDVPSRRTIATREDPHTGLASSSILVAASDNELLLLDSAYGGWQRRRISDWALEARSSAQFGAHNLGVGTSGDGRWFTETNGASTIPVWRTSGPTDADHPGFTAQAPISTPNALTLSPDGAKAAVADSGTIYVSPVAREGAPREDPVELVGNGSINANGVRFLGDGSHLLSASGDKIAVWNLGQVDRIGHTAGIPVELACTGCAGPSVAVAPDGRRIAVVDGSGRSGVVQALDDGATPGLRIAGDWLAFVYGPAVWAGGGRHVVLPVAPPAGGSDVPAPTGLPPMIRSWPAGNGDDFIAATGGDGYDRAVVVNTHGQIRIHDAASGVLRETLPGPPGLAGESGTLPTNSASAAVNAAADLVAVTDNGTVVVTDLTARKVVGTIPGSDASTVTFSGHRLLVQRQAGPLEVWDEQGSRRERVLQGDRSYNWAPVGNQQGTLVARRRSNESIVLADLDTGTTLATFPSAKAPDAIKTGIAFTPDGTQLITVTEPDEHDGGVLVRRDISDEALIRTACATAGRDLTPPEWLLFVGTDVPGDLACR